MALYHKRQNLPQLLFRCMVIVESVSNILESLNTLLPYNRRELGH
jgi:hypothetical protein